MYRQYMKSLQYHSGSEQFRLFIQQRAKAVADHNALQQLDFTSEPEISSLAAGADATRAGEKMGVGRRGMKIGRGGRGGERMGGGENIRSAAWWRGRREYMRQKCSRECRDAGI